MENWKMENFKNFKFNDYKKKFLTFVLIFFQIHLIKSQKIIETEPTKWLQCKDPWKSKWIRHFNSRFSMEYWEVSIKQV